MSLDHDNRDYSLFLKQLVVFTQRKRIVEVGVAFGRTTKHLCYAAKETGGHVYGFDLWDTHGLHNQFHAFSSKEEVENKLKNAGCNNFTLTKINTKISNFKDIVKEKVGTIDFAFIDACHSYEGVKRDFVELKPLFADDAIIAFHDTTAIDGVREFILDLRTKYNDGTFDLIDLPFGGPRREGLAILIYRKFPNNLRMDEVCGSPSTIDQIYQREIEWYNSQLKNVDLN